MALTRSEEVKIIRTRVRQRLAGDNCENGSRSMWASDDQKKVQRLAICNQRGSLAWRTSSVIAATRESHAKTIVTKITSFVTAT